MSIHIGASIALEISSKNASWVTMGVLAGLLYGFYTSEENDPSTRMFSCAILGGTLMGLMGNLLLWVDVIESTDSLVEEQTKTFHLYSA